MSLPPRQAQQVAPSPQEAVGHVKAQLQKTEEHLAECIDEIVFAETAQKHAEDRLAVTEECLQDSLGYISALESQVLIPAFGNLVSMQEYLKNKGELRHNVEKSGSKLMDPSDRTRKLLQRVREPSDETKRKYANQRDAILNGYNSGIDVETAIVSCELFLESKEELLALLEDAKKRAKLLAEGKKDPSSSSFGGNPGGANSATSEEVQQLRAQLERTTAERDQLIIQIKENPKPYSELQQQHHSEVEMLQKQITNLKGRQQQHEDERFALRERFETLQRALDQAYQEKALIAEEHAKCSNTHTAIQQQSAANEELHQMRLKMDSQTRDHSSQITKLESQIATLRMDLSNARGGNSSHERETVAQLQRTNQTLRNDLAVLQQRLLSSSPSVDGSLDTKIQAFEMTISALNSELAMVESKIASVEKHYIDERARIVRNFDDERRRFQMEREECDSLVLKMTNELECLVRENALLKQRIQ